MNKDTSSQEYRELKTELRSILISSQQGCSEQQLLRDYAEYNGRKEIPFRNMGYKTLIELLTSMPDVAAIDRNRGPVIIHGVADQHTNHIKKLVANQKKKKQTRPVRSIPANQNVNRSYNRPNPSSAYPRSRPTQNYSTHNVVPFQPYDQLTNVSGNQWDTFNTQNRPPSQPHTKMSYSSSSATNNSVQNTGRQTPIGMNQAKTVASFPPKSMQTPPPLAELMSTQATPIMDDNSSVMDDDLNYSEDDELASYDAEQASQHGEKIILLRKRIRQLLLKFPNGVWLSSVPKLYQKLFEENLNLEEYKLKNLMAFLDCVADFVDSKRDRLPDSTDRILLLKANFSGAVKREQQTLGKQESSTSLSNLKDNQNIINTDENVLRLLTNDVHRPIVDRSSFVASDFHYRRIDYTSDEPFEGFLGDVQDPWTIHIGNVQFIPKRDCMMAQLQEHYEQSSNQSIYVIPFEQLEINLSCVYYHSDNKYYRAFIMQIDQIYNPDIVILKIYLVDYGIIISDLNYHINSTKLKFLHKNFSSLSTELYDCRLADIHYPATSLQWPEDARQFIVDLCQDTNFSVKVTGFIDTFYCIYLWMGPNRQQSINRLLIQHGFAIEHNDSQNPEFQPLPSTTQSYIDNSSSYLDERVLSRHGQNHMEYNLEKYNYKYFVISIEHAYYFVKHPFTERPCLPCFEVARLLNKDETYVSRLNLVRETNLALAESHRTLFDDLRRLPESSKCSHINRNDNIATIILYDLSSIRDYLIRIKFQEGDVIDAFKQEYDDYARPGYWNEKKNFYINKDDLQSHQENLFQRREILNFRKEQLASLSHNHRSLSTQNEMQEIQQELNTLNQNIHSMEPILPLTLDNRATHQSSSTNVKVSKNKMRETLYRIARPFDQQFALNIRFNHHIIDDRSLHNNDHDGDDNDEIEERFQDLHRITKNVIQFFILESDISDEKERTILNEANNVLPQLIAYSISLDQRIDIYNYCLQIVEHFQPTIRCYVQRTELLDTGY